MIHRVFLMACLLAGGFMLPLGAEPASVGPPPAPGKWQNFWIDRVKTFAAENTALDPKSRNIVFLGDSLTQGFKLKEFFLGLPVLNRGIVSDGVCDFPDGRNVWRGVTRRLTECVYDCNPSHLIFLIGTNDVGVPGVPLDYWLGAYKYVIGQTREKFPGVKIILVTCPPSGQAYAKHPTLNSRILKWNALIRKYATEEKFRLIDLHALLAGKDGLLPADMTNDGLHFKQPGYVLWAEALHKIFREDGVERKASNANGLSSPVVVLDEAKAIAIARQAVATNDTWVDQAIFQATREDSGWSVWVWRAPRVPGGDRIVLIDEKGIVTAYRRGE